MDTLEFFQRVLPVEGFYSAILIDAGNAPQQSFFASTEDIATFCQRMDAAGSNTYFALSTFNTRFSRKQDNVKLTKALFLDIDCAPEKVGQTDSSGSAIPDKGYATQKDGLKALLEFLVATGMPKPMVVSSGRGLHVYWVLDTALPQHEWQPLADAHKSTYQAGGFVFDPAVTADSARVLRPIGTHNPKNGAEVKLLMDAPAYSSAALQNVLGSVSPASSLGTPSSPPAGTARPARASGTRHTRTLQERIMRASDRW